jgi:gamma-glutamylcyclotransferase (GGCT)/AIG2-like uncharacterized protein YtfP
MISPGALMTPELRVFAYGTLKRGFPNHDAHCAGVLRTCPAWLRGRLYKLSPDTPAMTVPDEDILVYGTASVAADIGAQRKFESFSGRKAFRGPGSSGSCSWGKVRGELLIFNDPETRLPLLDSLEDFHPGRTSTYIRALVFITVPGGSQTSAWTYIAGFNPTGLEEYARETWDSTPCC